MRKLSFIFIVVLAVVINTSAQTRPVRKVFDEGIRNAQAGQYEKALENYQKAIQFSADEKTNDEFFARIHFNTGVCLYQLKRPVEAVEEFNEAIRLSRSYQKAFYALGMAQSELKNWQAAEIAFREAVNLKKEDGEAWFDLALVLLEEKDFEAAHDAFQNAIKYKSVGSADAHNNIGVIYALKGDFLSAEEKFRAALRESGGKSIEAQNNLQFCKANKQNYNSNLLSKLEFSKF